MKIDLSDSTREKIEEVVGLDLTLCVNAVLLAKKALQEEVMEGGNDSLETRNIKDDLESIRLSLKSAGDRLRAFKKRVS